MCVSRKRVLMAGTRAANAVSSWAAAAHIERPRYWMLRSRVSTKYFAHRRAGLTPLHVARVEWEMLAVCGKLTGASAAQSDCSSRSIEGDTLERVAGAYVAIYW